MAEVLAFIPLSMQEMIGTRRQPRKYTDAVEPTQINAFIAFHRTINYVDIELLVLHR